MAFINDILSDEGSRIVSRGGDNFSNLIYGEARRRPSATTTPVPGQKVYGMLLPVEWISYGTTSISRETGQIDSSILANELTGVRFGGKQRWGLGGAI